MSTDSPADMLRLVASHGFAVCAHCGERIGVYEPITVQDADRVRTTSLAREPELVTAASVVMHAACASPVRPVPGA